MPRQNQHRRTRSLKNLNGSLATPSSGPFSPKRGDIIYVKYEQTVGIEINTTTPPKPDGRPSLVITVYGDGFLQIIPVRDAKNIRDYVGQVEIDKTDLGIGGKRSFADCRQLQGADPSRVTLYKGVVGQLGTAKMAEIERGLKESLQLN